MVVGNRLIVGFLISVINIFIATFSFAGTEIFPAEYIVLPAGTRLISAFYFHREFSDYYVGGKRAYDGQLRGQALVFAYTQYGEILGHPNSWSITLPYIKAEQTAGALPPGFGESAVGLSDLRVTYNFWPIYSPDKGYSLAVSTNVTPPTGRYDHDQALNAGDNRWILSMQLGWVEKLSESLYWDFTPEWKRFSTNTDYVANYRLRQSDVYSLTTYLRWQPIAGWEFSSGMQLNRGGAQRVDEFDLDNPTNQQRYFLAARKMLTPLTFFSLRYSQDSRVDNDLKINSDLVFRLGWFF
ncbi:transporter [Methylophilus sp. 13]|uniref:transporter n=1 Tax=Methylophilus sp. 13 TaxID=2781018 RepID=UPI00188F70F8|nr:transporter [Methylophilus sp. 13]MBF5040401.1 transporter [Methylophilus sp. 13]